MSATNLKDYFTKQLTATKGYYLKDLEAMTPEMLASKKHDKQRNAYDFSYEIAFLNHRVAARLTGQEPQPWPGEMLLAPAELQSKDTIIEHVRSSFDDLLNAWEAIPETEVWKEIDTGHGKTSPVDLAYFLAYHAGYHDGQLNYIQALHGDDKVHWSEE